MFLKRVFLKRVSETVPCFSITRPITRLEMPSHNGMSETPEMELSQSFLVCAWIALHLAGLLLGWATRLAVGSRFDLFAQLAFFAALTILGGAAWFSHQQELGLWIPTGFTMSAMVLMAVTDLRPTDDVAAEDRFGASY